MSSLAFLTMLRKQFQSPSERVAIYNLVTLIFKSTNGVIERKAALRQSECLERFTVCNFNLTSQNHIVKSIQFCSAKTGAPFLSFIQTASCCALLRNGYTYLSLESSAKRSYEVTTVKNYISPIFTDLLIKLHHIAYDVQVRGDRAESVFQVDGDQIANPCTEQYQRNALTLGAFEECLAVFSQIVVIIQHIKIKKLAVNFASLQLL